jgi:hypothetical protein
VRRARLRDLERSRALVAETPRLRWRRDRSDRFAVSGIVATILILGGAFLFTAGAVLVAWPVWAAGLALFAGGFILYRP